MSQYFDHNFLFKYQIKVNPVALESYLKIIQNNLKYDFSNSDVRYAKIILKLKNINIDESYSKYLDCFLI
jgi:hypothetical protein